MSDQGNEQMVNGLVRGEWPTPPSGPGAAEPSSTAETVDINRRLEKVKTGDIERYRAGGTK